MTLVSLPTYGQFRDRDDILSTIPRRSKLFSPLRESFIAIFPPLADYGNRDPIRRIQRGNIPDSGSEGSPAPAAVTRRSEAKLRYLSRGVAQRWSCSAEAMWWQCHRRLLSDALLARGVPVRHIFPNGESKPHDMSEFAKVDGQNVAYPGLL